MSFIQMNLDPNISKAIAICGYTTPTPIQSKCIPDIILGKDMVASAQTGTGKTAAFVLPALHKLTMQERASKPRVLILTPTRELAAQIKDSAFKYGKFLRFNMTSLVGGMPYRQQVRDLSRVADIIVATPGRLLDHMESGRLDLSGIEMLILDEADRMLDMGFIDDVQRIASETPDSRQTLLFSATVDKQLAHIVRDLLNDPIRVDVTSEKLAPAKITQVAYSADNLQHKTKLLKHFLENGNIFKGIIFSATKINADRLADDLCEMGFAAAPLHGDLKQSVRNRTIDQLRRGKVQFLVATDVAARGIDISDVTHVINYDLPRFSEDYVHRIGRTGRAGKEGMAISFVLPIDARHLQKIERYTNQKIPRDTIAGLEPKQSHATTQATGAGKKKRSFGKHDSFKKTSSGFKAKGMRFEDRGDKEFRGGERNFGARKSRDGEGSSLGAKKEFRGGERSFGARKSRDGEGSSFGAKKEFRGGERSFGARKSRDGEGSSFGAKKEFRGASERGFGARKSRDAEGSVAGAKKEYRYRGERSSAVASSKPKKRKSV